MTPEAHALAGVVRKSIQETEDAFVSYIEASVTLNYSGSDLDRMESEQEHSDAAEAFGFHVIRLYRNVALLAEVLGLSKLCDQVTQACPKGENAYELTSEDEGYSSEHLKTGRHWFDTLERVYLGPTLTALSSLETILHSTGKIIAAKGTTPHNEAIHLYRRPSSKVPSHREPFGSVPRAIALGGFPRFCRST